MHVHARTVVAEEWLWHEGCGLTPAMSNILDDVLELQNVVSCADERVKAVVDLTLAGGSDLVVAAFYLQASLFELKNDVVTHVSMLIGRGNRKVATLVRSFVGKVSA